MAINETQTIFRYKTNKCFLHKQPAILKLFLFLPLCIFCLALPPFYLLTGIAAAFLIAFVFKFTLHEQLTDLKPAFFYAVMMYLLSVFSNLFDNFGKLSLFELACPSLIPKDDFMRITLRLVLIVQFSALVFRTTSSLEIRESLHTFEKRLLSLMPFVGKKLASKSRFAENISLFLMFIPEIFTTWSQVNLAWKARNGREGVRKIKTTIFVLITLCMEKADLKAKALEARSGRSECL